MLLNDKTYTVPKISSEYNHASLGIIYLEFDKLCPSEPINQVNWPEFSYKPDVFFRMVQANDGLFLKFNVSEKNIRAKYTVDGSKVYTDSCVELFISPVNDGSYYNLEFNCIGCMLMGFRTSRHDAQYAPIHVMNAIKRYSSLGSSEIELKSGNFNWDLTAYIPYQSFWGHNITTLEGQSIKANLYKCGDELTEKHYLSWAKIKTDKPDFHRPEFFGELKF